MKATMRRWVNPEKVDRMTLWMLRRLFKLFAKKYMGPYIRGELDLEQLDFQLCAGAGQLTDVSLNTDTINKELNGYPVALKEGSVGKISVKLLPRFKIELDEVELRFVPKRVANKGESLSSSTEQSSEAQHVEMESEHVETNSAGGCSYLPVQEGVRVVANLFERLFFGMHVIVKRSFIAFEELADLRPSQESVRDSYCMLLLRIGCAEYNASRPTSNSDEKRGADVSAFTSAISFDHFYLELLDVCDDSCDGSSFVSASSKSFGQPVSLLQEDNGLSGSILLSMCSKSGCVDIPKVDADISLGHIKLQFTGQQIESLLKVVNSYRGGDGGNVATLQDIDTSHSIVASCFIKAGDRQDGAVLKSSMLSSESKVSRSLLLPGAKLISDWVHWNDRDKDAKEAVMSEEEFAASTEEFFDCLSGSGLWMWTCSAFSAVSAASSFPSGSVLMSQEFSKQVRYAVKAKIAGVSVMLNEGEDSSSFPASGSTSNGLSESANTCSDYSMAEYIQAKFLHIDLSVEVCQRRWEWQLMLKQIEACRIKYQEQDVNPREEIAGVLCSSSQPLQALVEQGLPPFPVSICRGMGTPEGRAMLKECFLRLLDEGHQAGLQVKGKHKLCSPGSKKDGEPHDLTDIDIHFRPLIVWVDGSLLGQLQRWVECFGGRADPNKLAHPSSKPSLSPPSRRKLHVNLHFSRVRVLAVAPYSIQSRFVKDHMLCLDLLGPTERPMVKLRLSDVARAKGEPHVISSVSLAIREGALYVVSPLVGSGEVPVLGFSAMKVLDISLGTPEVAMMELSLRAKSGAGAWLAERAWAGVTEQQKGGAGGRKTYAEFAATTATEVMEENNRKIREDMLSYSSMRIIVTIPQMRVELMVSQHNVLVEILSGLMDSASPKIPNKRSPPQNNDGNQVSVSLEVGDVEVVVFPLSLSEKKGNPLWERYSMGVRNLQMLHVVNLGLIKDVSYFWLCHGNGSLKGLLPADTLSDEFQLLTCMDNALGRGDGGGGNALATKSAGVEVSVISWPRGPHSEDVRITVSVGGCTFMAHGGRLDWLPGLITFFSQHPPKGSTGRAIHEKVLGPSASETCMVELEGRTSEAKQVTSADSCVLFSLDLHDAALCYEPGKEAQAAANLRARSMAQGQANAMEQFSPVSCCIAAAAVCVSSNAISNTSSKEYEIWLRDVALLLVDTTLRSNNAIDYTPASLLQAGYVKVAGEAVMEAVVCLNGEDGLEWEVKCANNQLRVETCHDTTAALGRLIAQLQQLFMPEVDISAMEERKEQDTCSFGAVIPSNSGSSSSGILLNSGSSIASLSDSSLVNSKEGPAMEGNPEDAFTLVRGCSLHPDSCPCNCLDLEVKDERFELLNKSAVSSDDDDDDDDDDGSLNSSLDHWSHNGADTTQDLRTPVSRDDGVPSFIEDYYVTKKASPSSSRSSSCKGGGPSLQGSQHQPDMLYTVDGSGGWYDGDSFNVLEDHVPTIIPSSGAKKQRGTLLHTTNRRLGLEYPHSVGRVVFQDFNLRWRLYGGSDWLVTKRRDSPGLLYATQISSGRQLGVCLEVLFHGVDLQHDTFPEGEMYASRLASSIREVRVYDCSKDAPWKKVLGYHRSKSRPRESHSKALKLELESVRPDPMAPLEEYRLSVDLLPLLLHLDQRHIDFLITFFSPPPSQLQTGYEEVSLPYPAGMECPGPGSNVGDGMEEAALPFFQVCELQPFSIKVDYVPRRVDIVALRGGNYAELVNLVSWKGIELELKHVRATGVRGWGALSGIVVGEWLDDISCKQIHKFVKGLGPIRPLFAVGSGAAKLVVLPAEYYRRDRRRLLRGMRKGAIAFLRSISIETVGVGVGLAARSHKFLLQTESALGSLSLSSSLEKVEVRAQPGDVFEGLQQACENLSQGLERTAASLIGNPLKVYQRGAGTSTAVVSAVRAAPAAAVAPVAAVAGALHCALLGVRNSLDPEHRRESEEKHSGPPPE